MMALARSTRPKDHWWIQSYQKKRNWWPSNEYRSISVSRYTNEYRSTKRYRSISVWSTLSTETLLTMDLAVSQQPEGKFFHDQTSKRFRLERVAGIIRHQWSTRPDPQSRQLWSLDGTLFCFVSFWKVGTDVRTDNAGKNSDNYAVVAVGRPRTGGRTRWSWQ